MERKKSVPLAIVNPNDVRRLKKLDTVFVEIANRYGIPPNWKRDQGFVSLCRIILEQQVSLAAANAHYLKLKAYLKGISPRKILKLTNEEMRECQISRQKAEYLRQLAMAVLEKRISFSSLEQQDIDETRRQLTSIKGIGNWTTDIYLMFCLQKKDIFPFGDIAVVSTVRELYQVAALDEIRLLTENWRPYRSLAAYFFWHYYLSKRKR